jgi:hypothetical protein
VQYCLGGILLVLALMTAEAANVRFVGDVSYSYTNGVAGISAGGYANYGPNGESGPIRMELWALPSPYPTLLQSGHKLAQFDLSSLGGGWQTTDVNPIPVSAVPPPAGTWIFAVLLTEESFGGLDDGYSVDDWRNFATPVTVGPQPPPALTPQVGLWWNPDESGTGYAIDYKHGVLVVTTYSFTPTGAAQWYLASGPLLGAIFTATLDKYTGGQCIACVYAGRPSLNGNDGIITISFSSPTSATVLLPGGRIAQIQPQTF